MLTCRELIEFLMSYVDDELPPEERAEFERHFAACRGCRNYLETYKEAVRLGKQSLRPTDEAAPASVPEGLVRAIMEARRATAK